MLSEPTLLLECNRCGDTEELHLTVTANGYDTRNIDSQIRRLGWTGDGDGNEHLCPGCQYFQSKDAARRLRGGK